VLSRAEPTARVAPARRRARHRETALFYLLISPWLLGLLVLSVGPIVASILISLTDWSMMETPQWIGLANYRRMLADPLLWQSLRNTIIFSVASVGLGLVSNLAIAVLLNQRVRLLGVFRTIFYLPSVVAGVSTAILWITILDPNYGLVNYVLGLVGIQGPGWLQSEQWVIPGLVLMSVWGSGNTVVIFLAGLQGIPDTLLDAARIDGAGALRRFWHVTVPMVSPIIFFAMVTGFIGSLQAYTLVLLMTQGGPANASLMIGLYVYQNAFQFFDLGYASALSWVVFLLILVITAIQFLGARRWVHYEGG